MTKTKKIIIAIIASVAILIIALFIQKTIILKSLQIDNGANPHEIIVTFNNDSEIYRLPN